MDRIDLRLIRGWTSGGDLFAGFGNVPLTAVLTTSQAFATDTVIPDGAHAAAMQVFSNSVFVTTLSTTITGLNPGDQYVISYRENARNTDSVVNASVTLDSTTIVPSHAITHISDPLPYTLVTSVPFTASNSSATLTFINRKPSDGSDNGRDASFVFDDVRITAVPEPGILGMLSLAGLGLLRRRAR